MCVAACAGLVVDRPADDRAGYEGGRREPCAIVLAVAATRLVIAAMAIVVGAIAAPFEAVLALSYPVLGAIAAAPPVWTELQARNSGRQSMHKAR